MQSSSPAAGSPSEGGTKGRGAALWHEGELEVTPYLDRARLNATLTIPLLYPPAGWSGSSKLYQPWRNIGARGVNHFASALLLALFPVGSSFLRLTLPDALKELLRAEGGGEGDPLAEVEASLSAIEREALRTFEASGARVPIYRALKLLIVGGNCLLYHPPTKKKKRKRLQVFDLTQYRVKRDADGNVLWIVIREGMSKTAAPQRVRDAIERAKGTDAYPKADEREVHVYTVIERTDEDRFEVMQEVCGQFIDESDGVYPADKLPWLALRWDAVDGQSYGHAYVDNYIGDLGSLDSLSRSIIEGAAISARTVFLRKPGSVVTRRQLATATNGEYLDGNPEDVTVIRADKGGDFVTAANTRDELLQSLKEAFFMSSAVQRNAERVTAEEIRVLANELERGQGGTYSLMSVELQHPLVRLILHDLTASEQVPALPPEVEPTVTTGLEALGRTADYQRIQEFVRDTLETFGPEGARFLDVEGIMKRKATALGLDPRELVRSREAVQADLQQEATRQAATAAAGRLAGQAQTPTGQPPV